MIKTSESSAIVELCQAPVALIGAGNLAWSLVSGLLAAETIDPTLLRITNQSSDVRLDRFARLGLFARRDLGAVLAGARTVLLLVKPVDAAKALADAAPYLVPGSLLISAVAGLPLDYLSEVVPPGVHIVRAMPNTASAMRLATTAIAAGPATPQVFVDWATTLFAAVGSVHDVPEWCLDAVTAVSGSGPAYVYYFAEMLINAGAAAGLDRSLARVLALETLAGAVAMLGRPGADPVALRTAVSSPRGTTEAAIAVLQDRQMSDAVLAAVQSAAQRSREISSVFLSHRPSRSAEVDAVDLDNDQSA